MRTQGLLFGLAFVALSGWSALHLWACAVPVPTGERVETLREDALIIWDAESKTQHFIREANFRSSAQNFGFLVPTPTQPRLREVSNRVFHSLQSITAAEYKAIIKKVKGPDPAPRPVTGAAPVEQLDRQFVAGYEAVVLKASDVDALAEWLESYGYAYRPALRDWLKQYTDDGWIITAFRFAGADAGQVQTKAIQMSFSAEQPFYPYREPADVRDGELSHDSRVLRLFVLSNTSVTGSIGKDRQSWPADLVWTNAIKASQVQAIVKALDFRIDRVESTKIDDSDLHPLIGDGWWLTEFEDRSSPRPGVDELYFDPEPNAATVKRPPIVYERIEYIQSTPKMSATTSPARAPYWLAPGLLAIGAIAVSVIVALATSGRKRPFRDAR